MEGNRVGIAMFLETPFQNGAAADDVILTGPIAIPPPPLEIIVDRATGLITMDNLDLDAIDRNISYYEITSAAGALDPTEGTGWNSLSDQNIDPMGTDPGETWAEAGGSDANILSEVYLLGSSEISIGETQGLGNAFAGSELADEDLAFQYSLNFAALQAGLVTYIGAYAPPIDPGDMNGDGNITSADASLFIQALMNRAAYDAQGFGVDADTIGDMNGDGTFDFGDIVGFNSLFAGPASARASAIPEPTTLSLAVVLLLGIAIRQRRRV